MSSDVLTVLVVVPTAAIVVALFVLLWLGHRTASEAVVATTVGVALAVWAVGVGTLAMRGAFLQPDQQTTPPIGTALLVALVGLAAAISASSSLRSMLANQKNLIRMNLWRLEGVVFLLLMANGQMPALWALPSGIGDVIVGATAFWVAKHVDSPGGPRRAVIFNVFGLADLVVAIGLGITTNAGPAQLFHTTPTSALVTYFPLALVPTFLVPLAFAVHIVSLWQLFGGTWSSHRRLEYARNRAGTGSI